MIVLNFIIGLLAVAIPVAIVYGLGKWQHEGESKVDLGEVFGRGFITLILLIFGICILVIIYEIGRLIVESLI